MFFIEVLDLKQITFFPFLYVFFLNVGRLFDIQSGTGDPMIREQHVRLPSKGFFAGSVGR